MRYLIIQVAGVMRTNLFAPNHLYLILKGFLFSRPNPNIFNHKF